MYKREGRRGMRKDRKEVLHRQYVYGARFLCIHVQEPNFPVESSPGADGSGVTTSPIHLRLAPAHPLLLRKNIEYKLSIKKREKECEKKEGRREGGREGN